MNLESRRLVWAGYSKLRGWRRPGGSEQKEGGGEDSGLIWGGGTAGWGWAVGRLGPRSQPTTLHQMPFPFYLGAILKTKAKAEKHTEENSNDPFSHLSESTSLNILAYLCSLLYNQVIIILDVSYLCVHQYFH